MYLTAACGLLQLQASVSELPRDRSVPAPFGRTRRHRTKTSGPLCKGPRVRAISSSAYGADLLDLFDRYVHGVVSRRKFLDGAQKFSGAGITAAALFRMLSATNTMREISRGEDEDRST